MLGTRRWWNGRGRAGKNSIEVRKWGPNLIQFMELPLQCNLDCLIPSESILEVRLLLVGESVRDVD